MTTSPPRATVRRGRTGRRVQVACHPGRQLFRQIVRKRDPLQVEQLEDLAVLRVILGESVAVAVMAKLGADGLAGFHRLGEHGPRALLNLPGVDEGAAVRLLCLWEASARISEPFRAAPDETPEL